MSNFQTINSYNKGAEDYAANRPESFYHKYMDKPAMFSFLPDLKGKRALCIGVGTGNEANELSNRGADVIGVDLSEGMLEQAEKNFPDIEFRQMDMMELDFPEGHFDIVYSSLALHYAKNLAKLFKNISEILRTDGQLLFSTTHPIFDSTGKLEIDGARYNVIGHKKLPDGKSIALGDYFTEEQRTQDWGNDFIVNFYHYTISTWLNAVIDAGFKIDKVVEPKPLEESKDLFPGYFEIYSKRPAFIIIKATKSEK